MGYSQTLEDLTMKNTRPIAQVYITGEPSKQSRLHKHVNCRSIDNTEVRSVTALLDNNTGRVVYYDSSSGQKTATAGWCKWCVDYETPEYDWREQGRCWDAPNPDLWLDHKPGMVTAAIICNTCPVRRECAREANGVYPGVILGGLYMGKGDRWQRVKFSREEWSMLEWWIRDNGRLPVSEDEWRESTP